MKEILESIRGLRVLVIGDLMVDQYIYCEQDCSGVYKEYHFKEVPGGAANAAANIESLGGEADCVGVVGLDREGEYLDDSNWALLDISRPTTVKTRVFKSEWDLILRYDREKTNPLSESIEAELIQSIPEDEYDAYVISDYGKGVVTNNVASWVIRKALRENKPVVVDPKGNNWNKYSGATVIKPNKTELQGLPGKPAPREAFHGNIVVTAGAEGMTLYQLGGNYEWIPAVTWNGPSDATGAGDTVAAALALALGAGHNILASSKFANLCAGLVIRKSGTAVVTHQEVSEYLFSKLQ